MSPEMTKLIEEAAKNSPLAAVAIVAMLILFKVMEQKVKMAIDIADQHKEIAERYKELCDASKEWGQQWILAMDRNTDAFNATMKMSGEMKDIMGDMRNVIVTMKDVLAGKRAAARKAE